MRRVLILAALLLLSCQALAAPAWQETYENGRAHFQAGRWQKAYSAFHQAFLLEPANPDISFYMGRASFEMGDFENAIMAFDRVLIIDPGSNRVKLELARSYMGLKGWSMARKYFNEVLESSPPTNVEKNILRMLDTIDRTQRRNFFKSLLSLEYAIDDNVHASPASETIRTVLGDVTLTGTGATPETDQILNTTAALSHRYQGGGPFSWQTAGVFINSNYTSEHELNVNYIGISTGPRRQRGRLSCQLKALGSYLELDNSSYLTTWGMEAGFSLALSARGRLDSFVRVEDERFHTISGRDSLRVRAGISPVMVFGPNRFSLFLGGEIGNAENNVYTYDRFQASLSYERKLRGDMLLYVSQRYQWSDYEDPEPIFGFSRSDDLWQSSAALSKVFWRSRNGLRSLTGKLRYTYQNSDSNIDLYKYEKNMVAVSLAFGF